VRLPGWGVGPQLAWAGFWQAVIVDLGKLGQGGQVTLPKALLRRLGIDATPFFAVAVTPAGAITRRPVGVPPVEI
jgi:hypothetical protein